MVWIFWFIYMFKLKSLYFLCIISMVLWGLGGGIIEFNYIIFMYMYIKRKLKCCIWINMILYVISLRLNYLLLVY